MKLHYDTPMRFGMILQTVKTTLAAAMSWEVATQFTSNNYPYFAPLAAVLTVQITVADSLEKAMQRTVGIILGVAVSLLIGHWFGIETLSIFLVILLGMMISNALRLSNQITSQVAASSLLVLAFGHNQGYAFGRIIETIIGCIVAVGINAFVIPPNPITSVEKSLLSLSKHAASTLNKLVLSFGQEDSLINDVDLVESLINETGKSLQTLQLAKQSQKYSPFLSKVRSRLEVLAFGVTQLEKVTVQIRGIRRSLTDLREIEDDTLQYPKIERILAALETAAVCIDHFGEMIIHASTEREERQKTYIQRAQTAQLACLDEMLQAGSPPVLREIGAILTDLNRILIEVSSERMT